MFGLRILYSGEDRYFANSDSQSSSFIGGREPVTGLHSVILSLAVAISKKERKEEKNGEKCSLQQTYPDSVNLVNPPKITIPKTLAALPKSQYATVLLLTSGKRDFALVAPCSAAWAALAVDNEADGKFTGLKCFFGTPR